VQQHLVKVYATLAATLAASVVGCMFDMRFHVGGILSAVTGVLVLLALGLDRDTANWERRVGLLALFGFLQGISVSPLVSMALDVDPAIVATAFLGTVTVFVCFSLSAIYSQRRSYLYLGGMLASACSFMLILSLISLLWRPMWIYSVQLYLGLAVFCAYILFDTQLIIEKADIGGDDFVWHAYELFVDFVAIFVRILIILLQNSQKRDERERKNTRRR